MTLNPIQFGRQVIDQYGRYLTTNYPISNTSLSEQFKEQVKHGLGGERFLTKGPYVYLNRPFEQGPLLDQLLSEENLALHKGLKSIFPFQSLHKHQENALRSIIKNRHIIMTTATGSGKTEGFLLPILDYCLKLRDKVKSSEENNGLVAILVYPMNALVNDQLKRLRRILAGTGITFGRFTSETPEKKTEVMKQFETSRSYTQEELNKLDSDPYSVPYPWEECVSEEDIREKKPRLLLTNYKQLDYLLVRNNDLKIFQDAPLKFIVLDEVHTYTGALGSEVACLIRRVKNIVATPQSQIICIGTSATVSSDKSQTIQDATKNFATRLYGVPEDQVDLIEESLMPSLLAYSDLYEPETPEKPQELLESILEKALEFQLQENIVEISEELLELAQKLCGNELPGSNNMNKLYNLLRRNRLVKDLDNFFQKPQIFGKVIPIVKSYSGRATESDEDISAEVLSYLTLGAIARFDEEPLLRPKIHYFVRGLQGLWCVIEKGNLKLLTDERNTEETDLFKLPLAVCRSCGQHYFRIFASRDEILQDKNGLTTSIRKARSPMDWHDNPQLGEKEIYLTDKLISEEDSDTTKQERYMCTVCGTIHSEKLSQCQNDLCSRTEQMMKVIVWEQKPKSCAACNATGRGYPTIRETQSAAVADVMILAQDMLSSMPEKKFQKLLIFTDNRQEAAHQAGWMKKRSERFRLRHVLYRTLHSAKRTWGFDSLVDQVLDTAQNEYILPRRAFDRKDQETFVRWVLLEEFATPQRKLGNIENLGLAKVEYDGLTIGNDSAFFSKWANIFGIEPEEVINVIRVILNYGRRHHAVSDPLFLRIWGYKDLEFRKGIITASDYQKPILLLLNATQNPKTRTYTMGWISRGSRSGVQSIVKKSIKNDNLKPEEITEQVNNFLTELWKLLLDRSILVRKTIKTKRFGKIQEYQLDEPGYKINIDKIGISEAQDRFVCKSCKISSTIPLPTMKCGQYSCIGTMEKAGRDEENYDVVRYTKQSPVPLKPYEHTAQIPKGDREKIETEFKKEQGKYNCIVATPTLELGVDIGALEMVLMRNAPPTPANYSQRSGRAGRRHRIAVIFTYTGLSNHDRYFFDNPPMLISGEIRIPSFSMQNNVLVRKHVHSSVLTALWQLVNDSEREIIRKTFPIFIWEYFQEKKETEDESHPIISYLKNPPTFSELEQLIEKYREPIIQKIHDIFLTNWPAEDKYIVTEQELEKYVFEMPAKLEEHVRRLFNQIKTYRNLLKSYSKKILDDQYLTREEENERRKYQNALDTFSRHDQLTYTLTFLSNDGFLPGYTLARDSSLARCLEPYQEIVRPPPLALREMTPATKIYANMNIFQVTKVDFFKFKKEDEDADKVALFHTMGYDIKNNRIFDPASRTSESIEDESIKFESAHLYDVEMEKLNPIDDRRDYRARTSFEVQGVLLNTHAGGHQGKIGDITWRYLKREQIRLVNLGPKLQVTKNKIGFPICEKCGETRSPFASDSELENFENVHQKRCKIKNIKNLAFHIDFDSDVLCLGPYNHYSDAINVKEAILNRARNILDMGNLEIEGFVNSEGEQSFWTVLYDPTPGGSGLLPQILNYWKKIIQSGITFHNSCSCKQACYSCMKNFSNQQL